MGEVLDSTNSLSADSLPLLLWYDLDDEVDALAVSDVACTNSDDPFLLFSLNDFSPRTGYNGYYRPAILTDFPFSLLYQIPENKFVSEFFLMTLVKNKHNHFI